MAVSVTDAYSQTLAALTAARAGMSSPEWVAALQGATLRTRLLASEELMQLQQLIVTLSNASLTAIANDMKAQADALSSAAHGVQAALAQLQKFEAVIGAVSQIITVVAKVVPLL